MSVSRNPFLEDRLARAAELSNKYDWIASARKYDEVLDTLSSDNDFQETGRIGELAGRAYFKAAFQSETRDEFKRRMRLSQNSYEKAKQSYKTPKVEGLSARAEAKSLFASFWLEDDAKNRREIIERCISLADRAAEFFQDHVDIGSLANTHRELLDYLVEARFLARDSQELERYFERVVQISDKAILEFEQTGDDEGLLETLHLALAPFNWCRPERYRELEGKWKTLGQRIAEIAEKIGTSYAVSLGKEGQGSIVFDDDSAKALNLFEAGLSASKTVRDAFLTGRLYFWTLNAAFWQETGEGTDKEREFLEKTIEEASSAIRTLTIPTHGAWLAWTLEYSYGYQADSHTRLAFLVTEKAEKKSLLEEAIKIARSGLPYGDQTTLGFQCTHSLSKAQYFLSLLHEDPAEKTRLLNEALPRREKLTSDLGMVIPYEWGCGVSHNYLALLKSELSTGTQEPRAKLEFLEGAVSDMQQCVKICSPWARVRGLVSALSWYLEWYGDILLRLYRLNKKKETGEQALKIYEDARSHMDELQQTGAAAGVRWKIATVHDLLGDHNAASQTFTRAAEDYRNAGKKIPRLASSFEELAAYMEAWSQIDKARLYHIEEQYGLAREAYSKAASLLAPTKTWTHLSKHYAACALLEEGETLSRQEKQDPAINSFNASIKMFQEARADIDKRMEQSPGEQEKRELKDWSAVSAGREKLGHARIELEEAKALDRKGEEEASGVRYTSAANSFRSLKEQAETEQGKRELETLTLFCESWAKMKEAETNASPELYSHAADSFAKVERVATRKRFRLLALANSSMCKALESGTLFRRTRDTRLYSEIKKQLETAGDYYQEGGFQEAAQWTQATQRLFDALVYLADAETEKEPKKKTELFHLSEKHLEMAASLYGEAGFPSKKEEALRHLKRARGEKELLLTPIEALGENPALTGSAVAPVSLVRDQATGLGRLEEASLVGNLSVQQEELGVGSGLTVELEMANMGRAAATLVKLENLTSEGLEIDRPQFSQRAPGDFVDLKGKRLEYLKTYEVKVPIKAKKKGTFQLRPRVLFVDDKGNYRSYEFEPVALTVTELGISGWLKGPR